MVFIEIFGIGIPITALAAGATWLIKRLKLNRFIRLTSESKDRKSYRINYKISKLNWKRVKQKYKAFSRLSNPKKIGKIVDAVINLMDSAIGDEIEG